MTKKTDATLERTGLPVRMAETLRCYAALTWRDVKPTKARSACRMDEIQAPCRTTNVV
jgi:hypothetical protein